MVAGVTGRNKVLIAPDKFKGSLRASDVAAHLATGLQRGREGQIEVDCVPVADGGDGTLEALVAAGFRSRPARATGPTGEILDTTYARAGRTTCVELASVCGLARVPAGRLDPLGSTSFGVGQLIATALDTGCREVVIWIGGSASTDGGAGMMQALGARLLDEHGTSLPPGRGVLAHVTSLDLSRLHAAVAEVQFVVACDVDNPLVGPTGAAAVYGPQKGASAEEVQILDNWLRRWASVVTAATGHDWATRPGAGAAGGVGFAALALLGATVRSGVDLLLELVNFETHLAGAVLVVTGEGSLDEQTLHGKAVAGVAAAAASARVPVVAAAGRVVLPPRRLALAGLEKAYALADYEPDPMVCMSEAPRLLAELGALIGDEWLTR